MRAWSIVLFILRSIFGSKMGWAGIFVVLFDIVWKVLTIWQTADFLPSRMTPLADFLNSLWGTLVLVVLGFVFVYRAVSVRWPDSPTETTSESETRERRAQDAPISPLPEPQPASSDNPFSLQETISTGEGEIPTARLSDDRTPVDVTPEYLSGLFKEHTGIQAGKLVEAFIGKWIRLSRPVGDVFPKGEDMANVVSLSEAFGETLVVMRFHGKLVIDNQIRVLKKGDEITVVGQIEEVSSQHLALKNCELERQ